MEPQLPSNFRTGTESLQKLEESLYKREEIQPDSEQPNPPKFIVELKVGNLKYLSPLDIHVEGLYLICMLEEIDFNKFI